MCEFCMRSIAICDADVVHGCGTGWAQDEAITGDGGGTVLPPFDGTVERTFDPPLKEETWRDRPSQL